jgi:hypothetical protein
MEQANKYTTKLSERRDLSQVPPILSPFTSESFTFSDATKRGAELANPSAELPKIPEAPEAWGARNAQKK